MVKYVKFCAVYSDVLMLKRECHLIRWLTEKYNCSMLKHHMTSEIVKT